eukprot:g2257.t1
MTKIVATIGPASEQAGPMQACVSSGMNVMRVNCSHATYEEIDLRVENLRSSRGVVANAVGDNKPYAIGSTNNLRAILLDTQGPEIRTGFLAPESGDALDLQRGATLTLTCDEAFAQACTPDTVYVTFDKLPKTVQPGDRVLLDDGLIALEVTEVPSEHEVTCTVLDAGQLTSKRGVNLPGLSVDLPAMSDKDRADIRYGIEHDVDFVAASFIRKAADVQTVRAYVDKTWAEVWHGREACPPPQIISKVENAEAMDNFDEILDASDGIMVARGDLGVEIPFEKVTTAQKEMVKKCNLHGKPVIVATQMLESMQSNPRPTRAEVADVANAVYDGADCVMLSGESAKGKYYRESIETMKQVILEADHRPCYNQGLAADLSATAAAQLTRTSWDEPGTGQTARGDAADLYGMAASAVKAAQEMKAACIVVLTQTGATARYVAQCRPDVPIVAFTQNEKVARQLSIVRGVHPLVGTPMPLSRRADSTIAAAKELGFCKAHDVVVLLGSEPAEGGATTGNLLTVKTTTIL